MRGPRAIAAVAAACVALWAVYVWAGFAGFMGDPVWYVDAARNYARGVGLVAKLAMPAQVALMPNPGDLPTRLLLHGPLGPLLLGISYVILGLTDAAPIALNAAFLLAAGYLVYRFGERLAGERAGLLAAALFWTNPEVLTGLTGGLTDPPFILLITMGWYALWRSSEGEANADRWVAAAGACLALSSACRLAAQSYWLGFFMAVAWLHRSRPRRWALFGAGFLLALLPFALYFKRHLDVWLYSPGYYALCWSPSFPGFKAAASYLPISSFGALARYPMDFVRKGLTGPVWAATRALESGGGWWLVLAALALFARHAREIARFRALAAFIVAPVAVFNAVFAYGGPHYLAPVFPPLCLLSALFIFRFLDENGLANAKWKRWTAAAVLSLLFLAPTALTLKAERRAKPERERTWRDGQGLAGLIARRVEPGGIVWTDSPHMVAWQGERPAIGLTATIEDGEKVLEKLARPPAALLLTNNWLHNPDFDQSWRDAFAAGKGAFGYDQCESWKGEELSALLCVRAP